MATGCHLCGSQHHLLLRLGGLADDVPVTLCHGVLLADVRIVGDMRRMTAWPPQSTGSWLSGCPSLK
jgi:hypothetical protein